MPAQAHALVEVHESGPMGGAATYSIPDSTVEMLNKLDGPVAIIAIAGVYRSGKSYLLNCLAQPDRDDAVPLFEVGPTINACTRGLWVWPTSMTVPQPDGTSLRVLFVDSEGLGAVGGTQQHDLQVFSLALLISSLFAYNSVGAIDESSISQLSFVTQLSKHIQVKSAAGDGAGDPSELDKFFPDFVWILRDFTLNLVDEYGNPITEHEYLENALMEEPGFSEEVFEKNRVRELVTAFFKRRDCSALMRPAEEEEDLNALQTAAGPKVRPGFIQQVDSLRTKMLGMLNPKTVNGKVMTGPMLGTMVSALVASINAGDTMTITDAWDAVIQMQGQRAYESALESFRVALALDPSKADPTPWELPTSPESLRGAYDTCSADAARGLEADMLDKDQVIVEKLREDMAGEFKRLSNANDAKSAEACNALLSELWAPVHTQVGEGSVEGLEALLRMWSEISIAFQERAPSGVDAPAVLNAFLANDVLADGVVAADALVVRYKEAEKEAAQGRSEAESKLVTALRDHMAQVGEAEAAAREREGNLRERAETSESSGQEAAQAAIVEKGAAAREIAEMKMNLELATSKAEESTVAAAAHKEELETASASLLAAQQKEGGLLQQSEVGALELAKEREMGVAAAESAELRTEQLLEELDLLKRTKTSHTEEAEVARGTIKELRMRLVSAEEECGELQRQMDTLQLAAVSGGGGGGGGDGDGGGDHASAVKVVQLEAAVEQEKYAAPVLQVDKREIGTSDSCGLLVLFACVCVFACVRYRARCASLEKDRSDLTVTATQLTTELEAAKEGGGGGGGRKKKKKKKEDGGGMFGCGAGPKKR